MVCFSSLLPRFSPERRRVLARCAGVVLLTCQPFVAWGASLEIVDAEFGVFDASRANEIRFLPTLTVPHRVGQRYGWIIDLNTRQRSVSVREEYLLPSAVQGGEANGVLVIPMERRNQASQRQLVPQEGRIIGEWEIGPGEPPGRRHLQVFVEGALAADFEYEVK
ncbi:hypothetical protein [Propionivibrio dicarboxylicus]|uniref:Uncharacterized protein n=1 Tax=Propionivibrio dicarboxylicus TaxID=83767 RepID=A0A1G8KCJ1_9RHOO|nr:hypothetical protein [Propionivibrio dicarboxylicus]SDI40560.1 hypothetical protein SAMN05660652_03366 [Propionivibrio dicarboxylicus]